MCTIIDVKATEKFAKRINKTGFAYAWKLVAVNEKGNYIAPFQMRNYNRNKINKIVGCLPAPSIQNDWDWTSAGEGYSGGVFHLFYSREKARKVLKWIKKPNCCLGNSHFLYKIVKVKLNAKDFMAVGHAVKYWKKIWKLNENIDNVCVSAFQFVE